MRELPIATAPERIIAWIEVGSDLALALPIMLEMGREPIHGEGCEAILAEAEAELVREVMG